MLQKKNRTNNDLYIVVFFLSERGITNSKSSSEFIEWFKVQVTQRCGPLSARQTKGTTLLQNKLLYCHINMMLILLVQKLGRSLGLDLALPDWSLVRHQPHPCVGKLLPISLCPVIFQNRLYPTCFDSPCKHATVSLYTQLLF